MVYAGVNTANDYLDHKSGADEANLNFYTPLYGGSRVIQNEEMKSGEMLALSLIGEAALKSFQRVKFNKLSFIF